MLGEYLDAAKAVVQLKQARRGVAVHVRLGGGNGDDDEKDGQGDGMESAGSCAVWAVTAGRDTSGVVRVGCSERAQTEVPRSAIQRVQVRPRAMSCRGMWHHLTPHAHDAMRLFVDTGNVK